MFFSLSHHSRVGLLLLTTWKIPKKFRKNLKIQSYLRNLGIKFEIRSFDDNFEGSKFKDSNLWIFSKLRICEIVETNAYSRVGVDHLETNRTIKMFQVQVRFRQAFFRIFKNRTVLNLATRKYFSFSQLYFPKSFACKNRTEFWANYAKIFELSTFVGLNKPKQFIFQLSF